MSIELINEVEEASNGIFTSDRGDVEEHLADYQFPVAEYPVTASVPGMPGLSLPVPTRRAIVRTDTDTVLGLVGRNYKVLSHSEALDPIVDALHRRGVETFKRVALTQGGARMFANIYFPGPEMNLANRTTEGVRDNCWPGITVINSLDGTLKYSLEATIFRLACTNGMRIPTAIASMKATHSKNRDYDRMVEEILSKTSDTDRFRILQEWANKVMNPDNMALLAEQMIRRKSCIFPAVYLDEVKEEIKNETSFGVVSVWGLYNAFNSVLEHNLIREKGKMERARMLDENLFKVFTKEFPMKMN